MGNEVTALSSEARLADPYMIMKNGQPQGIAPTINPGQSVFIRG